MVWGELAACAWSPSGVRPGSSRAPREGEVCSGRQSISVLHGTGQCGGHSVQEVEILGADMEEVTRSRQSVTSHWTKTAGVALSRKWS